MPGFFQRSTIQVAAAAGFFIEFTLLTPGLLPSSRHYLTLAVPKNCVTCFDLSQRGGAGEQYLLSPSRVSTAKSFQAEKDKLTHGIKGGGTREKKPLAKDSQ